MEIELEKGIYEIEEKGREGLTSYLHRGKQVMEKQEGIRELNPPREVVFKRVNPQCGIGGMYTIINEAFVLLKLKQCDGIVVPKIYDFTLGEMGSPTERLGMFNAGIIMEKIEGKNLKEKLQEKTPELKAILDIFDRVADSLHHLHQHEIIHLDISLDNIFVRNQEIILLDYGFARKKGEPIEKLYNGYAATAPRFILNRAAGYDAVNGIILQQYLPEVKKWDGKPGKLPAQESNDIYLLGNLLAGMLIGEESTKELNRELERQENDLSGGREELIQTRLKEGLNKRSDMAPEEKEALADIIKICISEEPKERPETIEKLMKMPAWKRIGFIKEIDEGEELRKRYYDFPLMRLDYIFENLGNQKKTFEKIARLYEETSKW